jgi:hypothetical protein
MKGKKNDFSMSFYANKGRVLFIEYVHDTRVAIQWMEDKRIAWDYANVYERRSRKYVERLYKNASFEQEQHTLV